MVHSRHQHLMKPFAQNNLSDERRIYNYRLSRGRRVIESTFGIMASRWRILLKSVETTPEHSDAIVQAIVCLHNYLIDEGEVQRLRRRRERRQRPSNGTEPAKSEGKSRRKHCRRNSSQFN